MPSVEVAGPPIKARAISMPLKPGAGPGVGIVGEVKALQQCKGLVGYLLLRVIEPPAAPQGIQQGIAMLGEGAQADVVQDAQLLEQADERSGQSRR